MTVYLVVTEKDETVTEKFQKENIRQFRQGTWFVRSEIGTCQEMATSLGFRKEGEKITGVVVRVQFYSGYAQSEVAQTLPEWVG